MARYRFLTTWLLDAPRELVWDAIYDAAHWPERWRGVERTEVVATNLWRSTWRSVLPYTLEFEFEIGALGAASTWERRVETTERWMNALGPLPKPAFAWNHHRIMRWGGEGLARRLGVQLLAAG